MVLYEHIAALISILHFNKYCFVLSKVMFKRSNVLVTSSGVVGIRI